MTAGARLIAGGYLRVSLDLNFWLLLVAAETAEGCTESNKVVRRWQPYVMSDQSWCAFNILSVESTHLAVDNRRGGGISMARLSGERVCDMSCVRQTYFCWFTETTSVGSGVSLFACGGLVSVLGWVFSCDAYYFLRVGSPFSYCLPQTRLSLEREIRHGSSPLVFAAN